MNATIQMFDKEFPQDPSLSISRIELIHSLCMERVVKKNKEHPSPKATLLEMLVDYLLSKKQRLSENTSVMTENTQNTQSQVSQSNSRLGKMKKMPGSDQSEERQVVKRTSDQEVAYS